MFKHLIACAALFGATFAGADDAKLEAARAALKDLAPDVQIDDIRMAPVPGFVELVVGAEILYVSEDGKYLVQGSIFDMEARADLTEARRSGIRGAKLAEVSESDQLRYGPKKADHEIWVFTDIDCGYCRRMHEQMAEYNDLGIRVNYMMFPRAGIGSESFDKAVSVWCAKDPHKALTDAKAGSDPAPEQCDNPIANHYQLGQQVGVSGTPAIFSASGVQLGGYLPPADLRKRLDDLSS